MPLSNCFSKLYLRMRKFLIYTLFLPLFIVQAYAAPEQIECTYDGSADNKQCIEGCYLNATNRCISCPQGYYCPGNNMQKECPKSHELADAGAEIIYQCYKQCDATEVKLGTKGKEKAFYNTDCDTKIHCVDHAHVNNSNDGCECDDGFEPNSDNTACLGIYRIDLKRGCTVCTVKEYPMYEKYSIGFAFDKTQDWEPAKTFCIDLKKQDTARWWGIKFTGYYTSKSGGQQIIDRNGCLITKSATQFNNNQTLYAHYDDTNMTITYINEKNNSDNGNVTFDIDKSTHIIKSPTNKPTGFIFEGWECTNGCVAGTILQPGKIITEDDKDTITAMQLTLNAKWTECPAGSYCINGVKHDCPAGTTSDTGQSTNTSCYIDTGNTEFCDNLGCFDLTKEAKKFYLVK